MSKKTRRPDLRHGYNAWAETYDRTANALVHMDERYTARVLSPKRGERILDAGCGTGRHFGVVLRGQAEPYGVDVTEGMLRVAQRRFPSVPTVQADLQEAFPFRYASFDAVLCSLVGEHLELLNVTFREMQAALRPGGRIVFSLLHPDLIAAGKEARFERDGEEVRLGATKHSLDDLLNMMDDAGFRTIRQYVCVGDRELAGAIPSAAVYIDVPLLLILEANRN